jgi:hypothetical protein
METSKFAKFSKADYDAIYATVASGKIPRLEDLDQQGGSPVGKVPVRITRITEVK